MVKDKFGYETPTKKAMEFKQGSPEGMANFQKLIKQVLEIAESSYPAEELTLNRFNLLLSALSELMGRQIVASIERHERGEFPAYGKMIAYSVDIRDKMDRLEKLFHIQELTMSKYLVDHPKLMKEENDHIMEELKKAGKGEEGSLIDMIFKEAFRETFGQNRGNYRKDFGV